MLDFGRDLRLAARNLLRRPNFALLAVLTLAAGIALNVTAASLLEAYLLRSLPYPAAERLHDIRFAAPGEMPPRDLDKLDWSRVNHVFEHAISWDLDVFSLLGAPAPEIVRGAWVTPGFMAGLGVQPAIGRAFRSDEFHKGAPQVAIISHSLWQRRFAGDPAILGRRFSAYVSDRPDEAEEFTIIGVLPEGFWHLNRFTAVFAPLRTPNVPYMARLRPSVSTEQAIAAVNAFVRGAMPNLPKDWTSRIYSTHGEYSSRVRPILMVAAGAAGLVLLIACANVAFLLIVRAAARQREVSIRLALGASRGRIAQMLAAEALVLGALATSLAFLAVSWTLDTLAPLIESQLGRSAPGGVAAISLGPAAIAAGAAALVLTLAFGLLPILSTWRKDASRDTRSGTRTVSAGVAAAQMRRALIALEVAGSITLLAAAALMVQSTRNMLAADLGIDGEHVAHARIGLRQSAYPDDAAKIRFTTRLLDRLQAIPGVSAASLAVGHAFQEPTEQRVKADAGIMEVGVQRISPRYFDALSQRLIAGRHFTNADRAGSELVTIVSESLARRIAGSAAQAVGRELTFQPPDDRFVNVAPPGRRTIVGVAADTRQGVRDEQLFDAYLPVLQSPARFLTIYLRTEGDPTGWIAPMAAAVGATDPEMSLDTPGPLHQVIDQEFLRPRFLSSLLGGLSVFAAALALLGVYGLVAFAVKQQEREVAIRMAVGAGPQAIVRLFLKQGTPVLLAGVVAGIAGAVALARGLESQLFGITARDTATLAMSSVGIACAAAIAMLAPTRQATRTDPATLLREE
ncbi:MAG: ABC transporter permease [Bryobacteraceae bacterium]|nr:ABC transporter permease [Bryobacteraceae bacterium]